MARAPSVNDRIIDVFANLYAITIPTPEAGIEIAAAFLNLVVGSILSVLSQKVRPQPHLAIAPRSVRSVRPEAREAISHYRM
ncbi:hypothetical protein CR983_02265 [Candidatus Saccharibacteria bacterium]|nr:MAG: hypothetical protein CR983_02265 [Candidatus Saccharibacteria bacterium]